MIKRKYLEKLEKASGYCNCSSIANLLEKRKSLAGIVQECDSFGKKLNLNIPKQEDLEDLKKYKHLAELLDLRNREYHTELTQEIEKGKLVLVLHDRARLFNYLPIKILSPKHAIKLIAQKNKIVTIHCSECSQQIDIAN